MAKNAHAHKGTTEGVQEEGTVMLIKINAVNFALGIEAGRSRP